MIKFDTATAFIASHVKASGFTSGEIISFEGYTNTGDKGASRWRALGTVGAASVTPLTNNSPNLSDASGNEFALVGEGVVDLNVLGGTTAAYVNIAVTAGLVYSQGLTSDVSDDIKNHSTVLTMTNDASLAVGNAIKTKEYSTGNGGGGTYDVVLTSSVTPNGFNIIIGATDPLISFVLRIDGEAPHLESLADVSNLSNVSSAIVHAVTNLGGFRFSSVVRFDQQIALKSGTKIIGKNSQSSFLEWVGNQSIYAVVSDDINSGTNNVDWNNFSLRGEDSTNTALLFDSESVRFSSYKQVRFRNFLVGLRTTWNWNNEWVDCEFVANSAIDNSVQSIGIYFDESSTGLGLSNATRFTGCIVSTNNTGVVLVNSGDGIVFDGGTSIEGNGVALEITGTGGCNSFEIRNAYLELNTRALILFNKSGAGSIQGLKITNSMIGYAAGLAGVMEVSANPLLGDHSFGFSGNRFRGDQVPTSGYALVAPASLGQNMSISWHDNRSQIGGVSTQPWDQEDVDWRFINSDVYYAVTLLADSNSYASTDGLKIKVEDGVARLLGDVTASGAASSAVRTINSTIPTSLRPATFHSQICTILGANIDSDATMFTATVTTGGGIRTKAVTTEKAWFDIAWTLNPDKRFAATQGI